jgi:hypothetical protein
MKRDVYADFNAEIYEVLNMDGTYTGFTAINYDELIELCERKRLNLVRIDGFDDDGRICRNCGRNCTELGGWYHELGESGLGDEYHCIDCHDELYTKKEWEKLCEEDFDEFYYTE